MPSFLSDGTQIYYEDEGDGPPVVLIHGFASSLTLNWKSTQWFATLTSAGYRVVALDCRGHGQSGKPHEPSAYGDENMGGDVLRLMDHLRIERAHLMGYSMGGMISNYLILHHEDRFRSTVLGGIGDHMLKGGRGDQSDIVQALEAAYDAVIDHPIAKQFRAFAQSQGGDLAALAACMRGGRSKPTVGDLAKVQIPILVVAGEKDILIGDPRPLAAAYGNGRVLVLPRRDHMSAVGDRTFKEEAVKFFGNAS